MSAVSNSVTPRSIALWITLREVSRSVRWPKLLQPRPTAETRRPELPRVRISMDHPGERLKPLYFDLMAMARKRGPRAVRETAVRDEMAGLEVGVGTKKCGPGQTQRLTGTAGGAHDLDGGPDQTQVKASPAL